MTQLLHHRGTLPPTVTVTKVEKSGVGLTAGYFSAIAKVKCTLSQDVPGVQTSFVIKTWPPMEIMPPDFIGNLFENDIRGYTNFKAEDCK